MTDAIMGGRGTGGPRPTLATGTPPAKEPASQRRATSSQYRVRTSIGSAGNLPEDAASTSNTESPTRRAARPSALTKRMPNSTGAAGTVSPAGVLGDLPPAGRPTFGSRPESGGSTRFGAWIPWSTADSDH